MSQERSPTVVDLFSGPGGLSTGFANAGHTIVGAVDYSEPAVETYDHNHDHDPLHADIRELDAAAIRDHVADGGGDPDAVDVVAGGPPCKGFSMANMQTRSPDNPKNDLFMHFLRVVRDLDPAVVVMENVPGLLSMGREDGDVKDIVQSELREFGYTVQHRILHAERYGVPQARSRVFFVGVKEGTPPFPAPTHAEGGRQKTLTNSADDLDPVVTVGEALLDLPELPAGGGGDPVMEYDADPHSDYAAEMRADVRDDTLYNHKTTVNREKTRKRFEHIPQGGNWEDIPAELMDDYTDRSRTHGHIYYRLEEDEPALTVANFRKSMMVHPTQDRLLSIREAARLQSFPDDYRFVASRISDRQQMVGDAVPVKLAEQIGRAVADHLANHGDASEAHPTTE
ncbi:DNA cytosine methyltransferase [Halorussus salilacus]|uniref:DNA cytosine methyltransferase n=1 Tax=Halorussus salilacus TaxID=2953750 RepID=UPI0020A06D48|nr:DNA cytosine methyltransferase [Halorussus salilacus]USZ69015.1 DNA cytosine methyltransferase [Halorussus salilacus]